jgi:Tfp pilus assembly protein PilX
MIFILVFCALAVSMASLSGVNLQIADNQRKANLARSSAESGLNVLRYWMESITIPGSPTKSERFNLLATELQNVLTSNRPINTDVNIISIANPVVLNSSEGQYFTAKIQTTDNINMLQMDITGYAGQIQRTIRVNYDFKTTNSSVFNYGIATKGPLKLQGSAEIDGIIDLDAGVYIESETNPALEITGNSHIAGDVDFTNPDANVILGNKASIGGETGQAAIDNHVEFGAPPVDFPVPIPTYFEHYVTNTYDPNNVEDEYSNVRIPAGTNPIFNSNLTLRGVIFIEVPNTVTFAGNVAITGIIVGNGSLSDNSGTNLITFLGTVNSYPVTELDPVVDPQFAELREETGTFLLAPGFSAYFGGDFETLNGAIAANGITFGGNAGGTINGSVINYSPQLLDLFGNTDLIFNRSGNSIPDGCFGPETELQYLPESYCEVIPDL